jgi:hypothetical protein
VRRVAATATALWALGALLPASALAHSLVRPAGAVVSYLSADATSLNSLVVRTSGNRIEFRDESVDGGMDPGNCTPGELGRNSWIIQTFCPLGGVQRVRVDLGDREDTATLSLPVSATVLAGSGADSVTAGDASDEVSGGDGNDTLDGGGGDDVMSGDQVVDSLAGGPGADGITTRDGESDRVACGDGSDTVDADTLDTVAADCESVTRTATAPPAGAGADDGRPPQVDVGAPTLQRLGRSRQVHVYATSSERGALSASGALEVAGLALPIKKIAAKRVRVGGGGVVLTYRLRGRHWREARRALGRGRSVVVRLGVVATDLAGQSSRRDAPPIRLAMGRGRAGAALAAHHPEPGDVDGDEVRDEVDNCPNHKNGSQLDTDRDGQGDVCDADDDNDGVPDGGDNCRLDENPGQEDADADGYGDACPPTHSDSDGIIDDNDNCDVVANPDQTDIDGDDRGDVCDNDDDGDDFDDIYDNCPTVYNIEPTDTNGDGLINDQQDNDGDGVGTACDPNESVVGGPGRGGTNDTRRPRLAMRVARRQRLAAVRAGLVVRVRCSEACGATVELNVSRRLARRLGLRRTTTLAGGSARLQAAGTTYVFVRFDRRATRRLFRMPTVRSKLTAGAVDPAGNRRIMSQPVALVR